MLPTYDNSSRRAGNYLCTWSLCHAPPTAKKSSTYTKAASLKRKYALELQPASTLQVSIIQPTSRTHAQACSPPQTVQYYPAMNINKTNSDVIEILNLAISQIGTSSNFEDTIFLAISDIVSLINQNDWTTKNSTLELPRTR